MGRREGGEGWGMEGVSPRKRNKGQAGFPFGTGDLERELDDPSPFDLVYP